MTTLGFVLMTSCEIPSLRSCQWVYICVDGMPPNWIVLIIIEDNLVALGSYASEMHFFKF